MVKVLSIDVGIKNLGYIYAELTLTPQEHKKRNVLQKTENVIVLDCNRVDITNMKHNKVQFHCCTLQHDRCIPDYLDHLIQEIPHFEECDILLIEQQPPMGIMCVQDYLFVKFRHKVTLLSPASIHKHFNLPKGKYELRKQNSEKISGVYLSDFLKFTTNIRKHDIADAMLMVLYYYQLSVDKLPVVKKEIVDFEQFRFNTY